MRNLFELLMPRNKIFYNKKIFGRLSVGMLAFQIIFLVFLIFQTVRAQTAAASLSNLCWKYEGEISTEYKIASDNEFANNSSSLNNKKSQKIFFFDLDANLISLNLATGKTEWRTELGGTPASEILYENETLYLLTETENHSLILRAVTDFTGTVKWQIPLLLNKNKGDESAAQPKSDEVISLFLFGDKIYILTAKGILESFEKENGKNTGEKVDLGTNIATKAEIRGEKIVFASEQREIVSYNLVNKTFARFPVETQPRILLLKNSQIITGDDTGSIFVFEETGKTGKKVLKFRAGAGASDLAFSDKFLFVSSNDNYLYALDFGGKRRWKRRFSGRNKIYYSPGLDSLFVAGINTNVLTVVDAEKGKILNTLSVPNENSLFTVSPVRIGNKTLLQTNTGIYVYSNERCLLESK